MPKRLKLITATLMVFILILATNLIDQGNFQQISNSTAQIHNDRVVALEIIYNLREEIYKKEIALSSDSSDLNQSQVNASISNYIKLYEVTSMKDEELKLFDDLKGNIDDLETLETEIAIIQSEHGDYGNYTQLAKEELAKIKSNLEQLILTQTNESRKKVYETKYFVNISELFTNIEIIVLIVLSLIIIIAVFLPKSKSSSN
ncbi:MAG: MCP four helix bundle domain-containing protein [Flavobacteriales bacterium]|nr:MCP four helix bundle domain-containing protein [Flavobacteriales bacterium]